MSESIYVCVKKLSKSYKNRISFSDVFFLDLTSISKTKTKIKNKPIHNRRNREFEHCKKGGQHLHCKKWCVHENSDVHC